MESKNKLDVCGLIGGIYQVGQTISGKKNGEITTFNVVGIATEEEFIQHHTEWADPAFDGLRFQNYYWIELQSVSSSPEINCDGCTTSQNHPTLRAISEK